MFEELTIAGNLLRSALDKYRSICSTLQSYCHENSPTATDSDRISDEMNLLTTMAEQLHQAGVSIKYSRNASRYTVPINRVPPEIMFHIFSLAIVSGHEECRSHKALYCLELTHQQPITFASVCGRWRKLVLGYPAFWSHIDLVHVNHNDPKYISLAKLYAERAGAYPLDIRVAATTYSYQNNSPLADFLCSIANHTPGSLSFILQYTDNQENEIFCRYLSNWAPGTLQKLVIEKTRHLSSPAGSRLIKAAIGGIQPQDSQDYLLIDLPHDYIEAFWQPIKILQLHGMYVDWGSQAYHGLVELCLCPDYDSHVTPATISESQLKAVLASSPGLRIFRIGIIVSPDISPMLPAANAIVPVQLDDLEILDLCLKKETENSLRYVLRLISPGSKPLKLTLPRTRGTISGTDLVARNRPEIENFLMRANVTELFVLVQTLSTPAWLFTSAPNLQTLCIWFNSSTNPINTKRDEVDFSIPAGTIDKLYIRCSGAGLRIDELCRWLSWFPPIQTLVLWKSVFEFEGGSLVAAKKLVGHPQLLNICPNIEYIPASDRFAIRAGWFLPYNN